jgi:hypothetical protein
MTANMQTLKRFGIGTALLLAASLGFSALAQGAGAQAAAGQQGGGRGGQGRGGQAGPPSLATMPMAYLVSALTLTDDQKTKIQAIQDKVRTDMQDLRKPDANGQRPNRAELQPKIAALNDQAKKDIEAVLTPAQMKTSAKVLKSAMVYNTVGIPLPVLADLKLTPEEETKLAAIVEAATKEQEPTVKALTEARTAGDQAKVTEINQTMQASRQATREKAMAVLTEEQKATLAQYQKDHPRGGARPPAPPV